MEGKEQRIGELRGGEGWKPLLMGEENQSQCFRQREEPNQVRGSSGEGQELSGQVKERVGQAGWSMRGVGHRVGPFGQSLALDLIPSKSLSDLSTLSTWIPLIGVPSCSAKDSLIS